MYTRDELIALNGDYTLSLSYRDYTKLWEMTQVSKLSTSRHKRRNQNRIKYGIYKRKRQRCKKISRSENHTLINTACTTILCYVQNVRSISNKLTYLQTLINLRYDVIIIVETWINTQQAEDLYMPNYNKHH